MIVNPDVDAYNEARNHRKTLRKSQKATTYWKPTNIQYWNISWVGAHFSNLTFSWGGGLHTCFPVSYIGSRCWPCASGSLSTFPERPVAVLKPRCLPVAHEASGSLNSAAVFSSAQRRTNPTIRRQHKVKQAVAHKRLEAQRRQHGEEFIGVGVAQDAAKAQKPADQWVVFLSFWFRCLRWSCFLK